MASGALSSEDLPNHEEEELESLVLEDLHHEVVDQQDLRQQLGLDTSSELTTLERHLAAGGEGPLKQIPISLPQVQEQAELIARQHRLEQDVMVDEQSKAMAQRTKVIQIGRATGFGTTLSLMRRWMPALLKRLRSRAAVSDEFKELYKMLPPEKLAFLVMERVLSQLLRPEAAVSGVQLSLILRKVVTALRTEIAAHLERVRDPTVFNELKKKTGRLLPEVLLQRAVDDHLPIPAANSAIVLRFAAELVDELRAVADVPSSFQAFKTPEGFLGLTDGDSEALLADPPAGEHAVPLDQIASVTTNLATEAPAPADPATLPGLLSPIGISGDVDSLDPTGAGAISFVRGTPGKPGSRMSGSSSRLVLSSSIHQRITASRTVREMAAEMRLAPMLARPRPWVTATQGPYLITPTYAVRTSNPLQRQLIQRLEPTLGLMYDTLNVLSATPWRINTPIYEVATQLWRDGGDYADLPPQDNLPLPDLPMPLDKPDPDAATDQVYKYKKDLKRVRQTNAERHSLRCDLQLKFGVAQSFLKEPRFYYPHNYDFRGRAYPMPPHLNHIGADLSRAMLTFAEPKPLGKDGLFWLKVHLANSFGYNKATFHERVAFVEESMPFIEDSVARPLKGARWWGKADSPWQCLATCIELVNALKHPGGPESFPNHLPVHQDGSCNGLQHYAALGGDILGAEKVNMTPGPRPADLYASVAELVAVRVAADAKAGNATAALLAGRITRKVIKQTVMTSVYGVTFIGARDQIRNAMKDLRLVADDDISTAAMYIARLTFDTLKEMFFGAKAIMEWLATCAHLIAKSGSPVTWISPIGLPIVQPYVKPRHITLPTLFQAIALHDPRDAPINTAKQKSAFPPNYIHSLDSAHMAFTALECHKAGLTFASVHDSFWTHASTAPQLASILRREFVHLHEQPLLQRLLERWERQYPKIVFPRPPQRGNFDLKSVLDSPYFFH